MKLAYLTNLNACDPLPKLGRKVERPKKPPVNERAGMVFRFEKFDHTEQPKPAGIDLDLAKPECWPVIYPWTGTVMQFHSYGAQIAQVDFSPVVSFADVAEKKYAAVSYQAYEAAWREAVKRVGFPAAMQAREPVLVCARHAFDERRGISAYPNLWAPLIAALEALR